AHDRAPWAARPGTHPRGGRRIAPAPRAPRPSAAPATPVRTTRTARTPTSAGLSGRRRTARRVAPCQRLRRTGAAGLRRSGLRSGRSPDAGRLGSPPLSGPSRGRGGGCRAPRYGSTAHLAARAVEVAPAAAFPDDRLEVFGPYR